MDFSPLDILAANPHKSDATTNSDKKPASHQMHMQTKLRVNIIGCHHWLCHPLLTCKKIAKKRSEPNTVHQKSQKRKSSLDTALDTTLSDP